MKKAILVVSFGTTIKETRQANIDVLEQEIQAAYPDREIRRAFTSGMVRAKIYEEERLRIDPPAAALENLRRDGFGDVIVQPTHIIPGDEEDSWQRRLQSLGYRVESCLCGLGENPAIRRIYLRHIAEAGDYCGCD